MRLVRSFTLTGVFALAAILPGCSTSGDRTSAASKLSDSDLEKAIQSRLALNPDLARIDVSANATKNEAILSGTVATEDQRLQAVDGAKAVVAGLVVVDKIDVKPREMTRSEFTEDLARKTREEARSAGDKIGDSLDDAWIHTKITAKLVSDSTTPARKINVDVNNNVVTLRGSVNTAAAKREAERIAKDTDGVKRVINLLTVHAG